MARKMSDKPSPHDHAAKMEIGLNATIVSMEGNTPNLLCVLDSESQTRHGLPYGPYDPRQHRTMEMALRRWVLEQTGLQLGYCEQLYTFADRGRHHQTLQDEPHVISVGYLALTRSGNHGQKINPNSGAIWKNCYRFLPWEDWRDGRPKLLGIIEPALFDWAQSQAIRVGKQNSEPAARIRLAFGFEGGKWDEERVLDRYELLYSAGLVEESVTDGRYDERQIQAQLGLNMRHDHRRILATAMSRLRSKLKYRPVVFELMENEFTLTQLQEVVEAISGQRVHKQNFRRLVEHGKLVEPTGASTQAHRGRPAALYRFRQEVTRERLSPGLWYSKHS